MSVTLSLFAGAGAQFLDNNGNVLSGGKIYTYFAGTTTPLGTYTTNEGAIFHTNPIVLDSAGRVPSGGEIWLTLGIGYKFIVKTSADVILATYDNIPSSAQPPSSNDADSIMYEQGYTVTAGGFVPGKMYRITFIGTTNFTLIGAINNVVGTHFIATGIGSGTGIAEFSQTVETKLRESVSVKDFGAVGDGVTDDTVAIQAAMAASNNVEFPRGIYLISSTLTFSRSYQRFFGASMGGYFSAASGGGVELKWGGAAAGLMVRVPTGLACPQIERIGFNANDLANNCLHLDVRAGSSIQFPYLERLAFRGYRGAALILGEADRASAKNGALQQLTANHLTWWGGGAGAVPASVCGILLNAQNCEFASAMTWLFDPFTSVGGGPYINHYNHIVAVSGGLNLTGVTSTRSTSHAIDIVADAQLIIDGWRSEDVLLVNMPSSSSIITPVSIKNLLHRAGNAPGNQEVITFRPSGISMPISVENSYVRGLIGIGTSQPNYFSLKNVAFHEIHSGTCQSATSNTCVLDVGASAVNDYYKFCDLIITDGTGAGQSFNIAAYDGATKTATIQGYGDVSTFYPVPDNTSTFFIRGGVINYSGASVRTASLATQPGRNFEYGYAPQSLQFDNTGALMSGLRNGSMVLRGISSAGYTRNLGSAFQHTNADGVSKTITFTREERDSSYRVLMAPETSTGTPAAGSETFTITKATTGFTVTFGAGVGVGNTRNWTWLIFRS